MTRSARPPRAAAALLLALATCGHHRPALPLPPYLAGGPGVRLPATVRPTRESLDLRVNPYARTFNGRATIEVTLTEPTDAIWLNAEELRITSAQVRAHGATLTATVHPYGDIVGLHLFRPLPAGQATLVLDYEGDLRSDVDSGLYKRWYGPNQYAYTDFEPMGARRAFPCFDQPEFKIPWRISLRVPRGFTAVANTPMTGETPDDDEKIVSFAETRPLPSYLVAFAVGLFETVDAPGTSVPSRVIYPTGGEEYAGFAPGEVAASLAAVEEWFGTPYPFDKLDLLAIPAPRWTAMENPGLVTYHAGWLLALPQEWTLSRQRRFANITLHELSHMWFGDLVTLAWWDDVWLNESFATWASAKLGAKLFPAWNATLVYAAERADAIDADAATDRRIRQPVRTRNEALTAFDDITYSKGASVLRMFEEWLGEDTLRRGVLLYLERHRWGTATSADFLAALDEAAGTDVSSSFAGFLNQPGVPLVRMDLRCPAGGAPVLALAQERYAPLGSTVAAHSWRIPVCVRWGTGDRAERACTLLDGATSEWTLPADGCPDWLAANAAGLGYYLVELSGDTAAKTARAAADGHLTPAERAGAAADARMSLRAGRLAAADACALLPLLAADPDPAVVRETLPLSVTLDSWVLGDASPEDRARWGKVLRDAYGARAGQLGWVPRDGDSPDDALLRVQLLFWLATAGRDATLAAGARALTRKWLVTPGAVHAEVLPALLAAAADGADRALFDDLVAALAKVDYDTRLHIVDALGLVRDPELIDRALALATGSSLDAFEGRRLLLSLARNGAASGTTWAFAKDHLDAITPHFSDAASELPRLAAGLCDDTRRAEVDATLRPYVKDDARAGRALDQALDRISSCAALRAAQLPSALEYLKKHGTP